VEDKLPKPAGAATAIEAADIEVTVMEDEAMEVAVARAAVEEDAAD